MKNWLRCRQTDTSNKLSRKLHEGRANQTPAAFSFREITIFGSNLLKQLLRLFASIHPHNIKLFLSFHWEIQITPYTSCWDWQFIAIFFLCKQSLWFILCMGLETLLLSHEYAKPTCIRNISLVYWSQEIIGTSC